MQKYNFTSRILQSCKLPVLANGLSIYTQKSGRVVLTLYKIYHGRSQSRKESGRHRQHSERPDEVFQA